MKSKQKENNCILGTKMTNNYKTVLDFCLRCGYSEETIKKLLSDNSKVWDGNFSCSYNNLTSLQGVPKIVNGNFWCDNNNLTSLEGAPRFINRDIYL